MSSTSSGFHIPTRFYVHCCSSRSRGKQYPKAIVDPLEQKSTPTRELPTTRVEQLARSKTLNLDENCAVFILTPSSSGSTPRVPHGTGGACTPRVPMHAVMLRLDQLLWAKRRACSLSLRAELPEHEARTPCADAEPRARLVEP